MLQEEAWLNLQTIMDQAGELPMEVDYHELVNTNISRTVTD